MNFNVFEPVPDDLPAGQRAHWQRRQLTACNTLEIQARTGRAANADTMAHIRRYVCGEIELAQAIEKVREQMAQEDIGYRRFLHRRNMI